MMRLSRRRLTRKLFVDLGAPDSTILLAGSGRSGTTWVADLINHDQSYRTMFEPFDPTRVPVVDTFARHQYLRAANRDARFLRPATAIMTGRVRHPWIDKNNSKLICRRRLVKEIRANLYLHWLRRMFASIPLVFLMRHPCAVVASKMHLGWKADLASLLSQDELMADHLHPFETLIHDTTDLFEQHVLIWAIENHVPRQELQDDLGVVFYERLVEHPEVEVPRLFSLLGQAVPTGIESTLSQPSRLSKSHSAVTTGDDKLQRWRADVSREQTRAAIGILAAFGLDEIYTDAAVPQDPGL